MFRPQLPAIASALEAAAGMAERRERFQAARDDAHRDWRAMQAERDAARAEADQLRAQLTELRRPPVIAVDVGAVREAVTAVARHLDEAQVEALTARLVDRLAPCVARLKELEAVRPSP